MKSAMSTKVYWKARKLIQSIGFRCKSLLYTYMDIIYECWSQKDEPELQDHMNEVHRHVAEEIGALVAPVGENWWTYKESWPNLEMYDEDGAHASYAGSDFAAKLIWETVLDDLHRKEMNGNA